MNAEKTSVVCCNISDTMPLKKLTKDIRGGRARRRADDNYDKKRRLDLHYPLFITWRQPAVYVATGKNPACSFVIVIPLYTTLSLQYVPIVTYSVFYIPNPILLFHQTLSTMVSGATINHFSLEEV
jgi:hypothetical protein